MSPVRVATRRSNDGLWPRRSGVSLHDGDGVRWMLAPFGDAALDARRNAQTVTAYALQKWSRGERLKPSYRSVTRLDARRLPTFN